jgi:hypothetical protein
MFSIAASVFPASASLIPASSACFAAGGTFWLKALTTPGCAFGL